MQQILTIFNFHVLRFIVNVWTFITNSNLNTILLLFAPYLQPAKNLTFLGSDPSGPFSKDQAQRVAVEYEILLNVLNVRKGVFI